VLATCFCWQHPQQLYWLQQQLANVVAAAGFRPGLERQQRIAEYCAAGVRPRCRKQLPQLLQAHCSCGGMQTLLLLLL
jgi:hypothetical protein